MESECKAKPKVQLWSKYFFIIAALNALAGVCLQFFNSTTSLFVESLGGTASYTGFMLTLFTISATVMRILSGRMLDKKGRRLIIIVGLLIFAAASLSFKIAYLPYLPVARFIQGIGYSMATTGISVAITDVIPKPRMGEGIGYFGLGSSLSTAVGPAIALGLCAGGDYSPVFYVATGCLLIGAVITFVSNYEADEEFLARKTAMDALAEAPVPSEAAKSAAGEAAHRSIIWTYFEKTAIKPTVISLFISLPSAAVVAFLMLYAKQVNIENASLYYTFNAILMVVARLCCGKIADKFGPLVSAVPALILGAAGYLCLMLSAEVHFLFFVAGGLIGLATGIIQPTLNATVIKLAPGDRRGAASATYMMSFDLGIGAGSFIWGLLIDLFHNQYVFVFGGCVVCMGIALLLSFLWLREKKAD